MSTLNDQEALKLIKLLCAAYPRQELRKDTIKVYAGFLEDLDYKLAEGVVSYWIKTSKWFPSIAELRLAAADKQLALPTVDEAMQSLKLAVRGGSAAALSRNSVLRDAVETVGFHTLGHSDRAEALYKQVADSYTRLRERALLGAASTSIDKPPVAGSLEYKEYDQDLSQFAFLDGKEVPK